MSETYDAIIIGAGIIGACTAYELAKRGWRTLNLDKLPAAGYGSTGASCAIIRTHYSTLDGAALAYESYFAWDDWAGYLAAPDERGLARFVKCGCLVMKTEANGQLRPICRNMDRLGIPWEDWGAERIKARLPFYDLGRFGPPKRPDDPAFGEAGGGLEGGVFFPCAGYINDPQLASHNVQRAAEARGAVFRFNSEVVAIRRAGGRVEGVTLASGETLEAPGRGQRRRSALGQDQPHGRGRGGHADHDPRAQAGGRPRALPAGLRLRARGPGHLGFGHRLLLPAGDRQPPPDRQRGPAVRCARVGRPRRLRPQFLRAVAGPGATGGAAHPGPAGLEPAQGRGRPLRRHRGLDPDLRQVGSAAASTWRSAPAAISSRTRRSPAP